jgi:phosphinothricin acetyltransferase
MDSDIDSTKIIDMQENRNLSSLETILRLALESDLEAINDIYNYYVLQSTCTYQEEPESLSDRQKWFHNHGQKYPATVAECNEQVVGWSSLSPYHKRSAYRYTVENSIYIHHDWHGRGIGSLLLHDLIQKARALDYRAIIAGIDADQSSSIALHAKYNFQHVGHLRQVGFKFDRWLDVIYMELLL